MPSYLCTTDASAAKWFF